MEPAGPFTGLDVSAIVANFGSFSTRIGLAGKDLPAVWDRTVFGEKEGDDTSSRQFSWDVSTPEPNMAVKPFLKDGLMSDWDALEAYWRHVMDERLAMNPSEHPVLLADAVLAPKADRARWAELMFEKFQTPGVFIGKEPVLACYAHARTSGLVVDIGHQSTTVTPVEEGYALMIGARRSLVAGRAMDEYLHRRLFDKGVRLRPHYAVQKRPSEDQPSAVELAAGAAPQWTYETVHHEGLHSSFERHHLMTVVRDCREHVCSVSDVPFDEEIHSNVPNVPYELPDGSILQVDADRFRTTELLFDPSPVAEMYPGSLPLPRLLVDSMMAVDPDVRRDTGGNLVLCGGCSTMERLGERVRSEVSEMALSGMGVRAKLVNSPTNERSLAPWLGGSILASMGTFPDMWVGRSEWDEHGAAIIHRKCP